MSRPRPERVCLGGVQGVSAQGEGEGVSRSRPEGGVVSSPRQGVCIPACTEADTHTPSPQQTATAVDGTHPTGMHSCFKLH